MMILITIDDGHDGHDNDAFYEFDWIFFIFCANVGFRRGNYTVLDEESESEVEKSQI